MTGLPRLKSGQELRLEFKSEYKALGHVHIYGVQHHGQQLVAFLARGPCPEPAFDEVALDRHLQNGSSLLWQRATEIAVQVARGLQYAHDRGVLHWDIKPQNILLREDGAVSVSDSGIVRALASSTRTRTSSVMGTPAYMSPEQWASGDLE